MQPDCCAAILGSSRQHSSVKACFDDWIHAFFCKASFVPLAASISGCILCVIRHSFLPLIPTGKKTVPICSVFVSGYSAADSQDSRTHGEIRPGRRGLGPKMFRVLCRVFSLDACLLFAAVSSCPHLLPHSLHSPIKPASLSSPDFPAFWFSFNYFTIS